MPFNPYKYLKNINEEMTTKKAESLFALAHKGLTPQQVKDTHVE